MKVLVEIPEPTAPVQEVAPAPIAEPDPVQQDNENLNWCAGKSCGQRLPKAAAPKEIVINCKDEIVVSPRVRKSIHGEVYRFCQRCFRKVYGMIRLQHRR